MTPGVCFILMKSKISGWSYLRIAIFAPRRVPPCLMTSVIVSNKRMNERAPDAMPWVFSTLSPAGRRLEKEKPVPPPDFWIKDCAASAFVMPSMESGTGRT